MENNNVRFKVSRFAFETRTGSILYQYMITDNLIPALAVNQWIEAKSIRKISTGREYAKKLVVFFNYLNQLGVEYEDVKNKNVDRFINYLIYGDLDSLKIRDETERLSYSTISQYVTIITEFYRWIDNNYDSNITFYKKQNRAKIQKSYFYGQIYSRDYTYIINHSLSQMHGKKEYIKWYDEEQITMLAGNFSTLRDEVIFRITMEGFRIDEVLSMELTNYDAYKHTVKPSRSKGKQDIRNGTENNLRTVALPEETCSLLNRYLQTERMTAENESGVISNTIFINLKRGNEQGKPLTYSNYYKVFKRCAKKAGLDTNKIRTHSGRSTKVMQMLEHQTLHPEDGITDAIIQHTFGWRSSDSINSYRDNNNQVIANEIMKKLHKKEDNQND